MNAKKFIILVVICAICISGVSLLYLSSLTATNVILNVEFPIKSDTLYYEEFTVKTDGVLKIEMTCFHESSHLLWYIMDCDVSTFVNRGEGEFYDFTYKRNINGDNSISDVVGIEEGIYTFVYVQTAGSIGEQTAVVKVVFEPA
jgi:hypothetical protein